MGAQFGLKVGFSRLPDNCCLYPDSSGQVTGSANPQTHPDSGSLGYRYCFINKGPSGGAGAKGDPHLKNVNGNKFDVVRQGNAPLLKISSDSDGATNLKIIGRIEGATRCAEETMITALNISGSWLEQNVLVSVGDHAKALHVIVNGQQVWSASQTAPEYQDRLDWSVAGGFDKKYQRNFVFNRESDKFFVEELDTSKTAKTDPGVQIQMSANPKLILKILRPMRHEKTTPHLNLDIKGLGSISRSLKVGGLLGNDDHSDWIKKSEDCKESAFSQHFSEIITADGSIASASY